MSRYPSFSKAVTMGCCVRSVTHYFPIGIGKQQIMGGAIFNRVISGEYNSPHPKKHGKAL